ncbi:hypothetical protein [uncultured Sulfitobacter sp.]|uniref:hypothetical protein n=1 Tax=uncultured Sulfitobacter sp. TaxID=191468 RepID=UPI0030DC617F
MHQDDEIYAHFGVAALAAQVFEQNVALALSLRIGSDAAQHVLLRPSIGGAPHRPKDFRRLTLGPLVSKLKEAFEVDDEVAEKLAEALACRNSLMHGFFPRHARNLQKREGRALIKQELEGARELLWEATRLIAPLVVGEAERLLKFEDMVPSDGFCTKKDRGA